MTRAASLTVAAALALVGCADPAPEFAAVSVTLPDDEGVFPEGPGVEAVTNNCSACHSPSMILNQPRLTRAEWQKSIDKMRKVFKAEIGVGDEAAILSYLEATSAVVR